MHKEKDRFMKQKRLFLAVGAGMLILFLVAAVAFSGAPNLFSSDEEDSGIASENVVGDVSIRRSGNNYTLKNDIALYPGDEIIMGRNAECEIVAESRARITLDRDSRVAIREFTDARFSVEVLEGAVFFDLIRSSPESEVVVKTAYAELLPATEAMFSVEVYTGTQTVNLYEGEASLLYEEQTRQMSAGDLISMVQNEDELTDSAAAILVSELRQFLLEELIARGGLCFEVGQLEQVIADRRADAWAPVGAQAQERMTCTVEIRCDTALAHPEAPGVELPRDGVILAATPVKFTQGESAYDVLRRVCKAAGIGLDYRYYPMISGYYVTEIGGLGSHDYGPGSGWLYKVNGWFPNYGASKHEVEDRDVIVWLYTCEGGGTDLGREEWVEKPTS